MGKELNRLLRSNRRNFHFLIGGLYGDLLYHHGAGSRHAKFWTSEDVDARTGRVRIALPPDVAFGGRRTRTWLAPISSASGTPGPTRLQACAPSARTS